MILAIIGLLLSICTYEIDVTHNLKAHDPKLYPDPMDLPRNVSKYACIGRWITIVSTIFSLICLIMRHHYILKWINKYFRDENRDPNSIYFMYDEIIT